MEDLEKQEAAMLAAAIAASLADSGSGAAMDDAKPATTPAAAATATAADSSLGQASSSTSDAAAPAATSVAPTPASSPGAEPAGVTTLADAQGFQSRPPPVPDSTLGGGTTCIVCFVHLKSYAAVPCGHQCVCKACSVDLEECPYCCSPAEKWMLVRVV